MHELFIIKFKCRKHVFPVSLMNKCIRVLKRQKSLNCHAVTYESVEFFSAAVGAAVAAIAAGILHWH